MARIDAGTLMGRALQAEGIEFVFTQAVVTIAPFYAGCEAAGIRVIPCRTEQAATHGADGYARSTLKPGVAMFTSGPGFINAFPGIANAYLAGSPCLFIARGGSPPGMKDKGALMEMEHDYLDLVRPITKWARICYDVERIPEYVSMALRHSMSGRPGPSYLEIPTGLIFGDADESEVRFPTNYRTRALTHGDPAYVQRATDALLAAERPVVMAGSGVFWDAASEELRELAESFALPVYLNAMGRGCLPPDHPNSFSYSRRAAFGEADVILAVGLPFDFRVGYGEPPTWAADATVIQVDVDPTEIGRNRGPDIGITGSVKAVLRQLLDARNGRVRKEVGWLDKLRAEEAKRAQADEVLMSSDIVPMHPLRVAGEVRKFLQPDDVVIGDGGYFVNFAARVLPIHKPGHWMDPGIMGCLGVGPGFAMAAKLAHPGKRVLLMAGDGAFGYNMMELETMSRLGINVVTVVGNDGGWAMERATAMWKWTESTWADLNPGYAL